MFLTDRDCITIDDVIAIDPEVGEVAATEKIPTEGDRSFIHLAVMEAGNRLIGLMQNFSGLMQNFSYPFGTSSNYVSSTGMTMSYYDSTPAARIRLGQIVVDSDTSVFDSPLKTWIKYIALRNFYQIASNRIQNDRYEMKKKAYQCDIDNTHWPALKASGIPMCFNAIPCPGAQYELRQGVWSAANVTTAPVGGTSGGTFDVAITWTSSSLNAESAPSSMQTISVSSGQAIHVDINSLTVPNTTLFNNTVQSTGLNVTTWNIYAGTTGQLMYLQASVPVATKTFTLSADPISTGTIVGTGQQRDVDLTIINAFLRA